jgi:hypothetical protein
MHVVRFIAALEPSFSVGVGLRALLSITTMKGRYVNLLKSEYEFRIRLTLNG